jgi:hypothetical protein
MSFIGYNIVVLVFALEFQPIIEMTLHSMFVRNRYWRIPTSVGSKQRPRVLGNIVQFAGSTALN